MKKFGSSQIRSASVPQYSKKQIYVRLYCVRNCLRFLGLYLILCDILPFQTAMNGQTKAGEEPPDPAVGCGAWQETTGHVQVKTRENQIKFFRVPHCCGAGSVLGRLRALAADPRVKVAFRIVLHYFYVSKQAPQIRYW